MSLSYSELVQRSESLAYQFPINANRLASITGPPFHYSPEEIALQAVGVRPIIHQDVVELAKAYLSFKSVHGSEVEKQLYQQMSLEAFWDKLIRKRPLMFMTADDEYILRDGKTTDFGGFELIGTDEEKQPLVLTEYNSYSEMQIAVLIGVSVPTYFINNGNRNNFGQVAEPGSFEEKGIYTGLVGARFEREGLMEWQHMVISPEQNTAENGYGPQANLEALHTKALAYWATFYGEGNEEKAFFPDYNTAAQDKSGKFLPFFTKALNPHSQRFRPHDDTQNFLNVHAYKHRIRMIVEPFLKDTNDRAKEQSKQAYVIAIGYGIGVWAIPGLRDEQAQLIVEVFADVILDNDFPHISDLVFSWYPASCRQCGNASNGEWLHSGQNEIRIHFNQNNPMEKLTGADEGKLLVASYAWDGNSYPGNEYWAGMLAASGDPAAACCSTISELQNPDVNPALCGKNIFIC